MLGEMSKSDNSLAVLVDKAAVALESLRTQWRVLHDLSTHERMALAQIRVYGPMPMSELASRLSLSRAAVTSLVDRLEADGWVKRELDDLDRRRTLLKLTSNTVERFQLMVASFNDDLKKITHDFSDNELNTVTKFLDSLVKSSEAKANSLRSK